MWLSLMFACGGDRVTVFVTPGVAEAFVAFARHTPLEDLSVVETSDPVADASGRGIRVAVVEDLECSGCFEVTGSDRDFTVHGGDLLGLQYGLGHLFEGLGLRFHHPHSAYVPADLEEPGDLGGLHEPEVDRRGLHLHTLHPTDGFFDFWEPTEGGLERAEAVMDWAVKQRANHIQWVALDDIIDDPTRHAEWESYTSEVLAAAGARGLTTGLGIQLFGSGNLQQAFDLLDAVGTEAEQRAAVSERLALVSKNLDFDVYNLSFGEFFDEEPEAFIESATWAVEEMGRAEPGVEVPAVVHVGADLEVEYGGETLLYYHLAKFVDGLKPWVHTVMYYTLFDDAGGAYHHDDFTEHRELLLGRLEEGEPVGYFPETAYWVTFDNSVPQAFPIYARSRHRDLEQIRAAGPQLEDHVLFSTGWEWGYWMHDVAALRHSYELGDDWCEPIRFHLDPVHEELAPLVCELGDVQHGALIEQRLAPWVAGQDNLMVLGYQLGIVSQPARPTWEQILESGDEERQLLVDEVLTPLEAYADAVEALDRRAAEIRGGPRVEAEVTDGLHIDAVRARFMVELLWGLVDSDASRLDAADSRLQEARGVVASRHADLHDPVPDRLVEEAINATIYPYGYLNRADTLCFWERELNEARNRIEDAGLFVPGCSL